MKRLSYLIYRLSFGVVLALLMAACSSDSEVTTDQQQPLPEGMGRIRITICTPEDNPDLTRAVNTTTPWLEPDHEWEKLHSFRILIFNKTTGKLEDIIERTDPTMSASTTLPSSYKEHTVTSDVLPVGSYYIYATANCHKDVNTNDAYNDGFVKGNTYTIEAIEAMTLKLANGYSEKNIPMSGKLTTAPGGSVLKEVVVSDGVVTDVTDTPLTVWRMLGKIQLYFTNESKEEIQIMGIEVDPINQASPSGPGIYLFSHDNLTSTANLDWGDGTTNPGSGKEYLTLPPKGTFAKNAREDVGPVTYETSTTTPLLTLEAKNDGDTDEGTLFFYVNESDATFTMTQNQYSLRFKIKRGGTISELRYGVTTHYGDGSTGQDGFNVIRRNDWIHIPIILTDWQMRIEPLAFVPIGGYPAATVSSDGLTATYSTGGMIALQPFIKKKNDATWRNFGDPEVKFVSISWKNSDGTNIAYFKSDGTLKDGTNPYDPEATAAHKILKTAFYYDDVNQFIVGELDNNLAAGTYKTTITINVDLGKLPDPVYRYTFSCNVILTK